MMIAVKLIRWGLPPVILVYMTVIIWFIFSGHSTLSLGIIGVVANPSPAALTEIEKAGALIGHGLVVIALIFLWRLFSEFASERFFSRAATGNLRLTATFLCASIIVSIAESALTEAPGELSITLDSTDVLGLLVALIFYVVAQVLARARLQEEELERYF